MPLASSRTYETRDGVRHSIVEKRRGDLLAKLTRKE